MQWTSYRTITHARKQKRAVNWAPDSRFRVEIWDVGLGGVRCFRVKLSRLGRARGRGKGKRRRRWLVGLWACGLVKLWARWLSGSLAEWLAGSLARWLAARTWLSWPRRVSRFLAPAGCRCSTVLQCCCYLPPVDGPAGSQIVMVRLGRFRGKTPRPSTPPATSR